MRVFLPQLFGHLPRSTPTSTALLSDSHGRNLRCCAHRTRSATMCNKPVSILHSITMRFQAPLPKCVCKMQQLQNVSSRNCTPLNAPRFTPDIHTMPSKATLFFAQLCDVLLRSSVGTTHLVCFTAVERRYAFVRYQGVL